jgi:hypothetical protein
MAALRPTATGSGGADAFEATVELLRRELGATALSADRSAGATAGPPPRRPG